LGDESGCGTPNTDRRDGEKRPYPIDPPELRWPPDEDNPWPADKVYFQLIESSPRQAAGRIHRKDKNRFPVRSLTPPQATGNALAIAVQGDAINSAVGTVDEVNSLDQPNTLIRSSEAALTGLGSTLGLHTFGKGSLNVYFDDFGYQSFVDQSVAISQHIQY
jgi:hypothetical protein